MPNNSKIVAYIRASTDKQNLTNQRHEILTYTNKNNLKVDEFMEIQISSRKTHLNKEGLVNSWRN